MFTDMVGYSALAQRDDELALELLEEHRRLLREIFPRFHGTEVKTIGDGFLVEFHSALEAVQCAVEIQRALSKRNDDMPLERRVEIRIGVHIGDVVHRNGDVYGDGVNIASRIERLAGAGGICVSMDVERQIRNTLEARLEKLAPTELKNISIPMDLFRIILPWEKRAPIVVQSETKSTPTSRKFLATDVALFFLLMIGVGWWWSDRPRRTPTSPAATTASSAEAEVPAKSIAEGIKLLTREWFAAGGDVAGFSGIWVYLDVIERRFTDAFQALEKKVVSNDLGHLQHLAARVALRVLAGEHEAAKSAGEEALPLLEARLRERPDDSFVMMELAWVYLALGRNADALRLAREAAASIPIEKDAVAGPTFQIGLAQIEARAGAPEEAVKEASTFAFHPGGPGSFHSSFED